MKVKDMKVRLTFLEDVLGSAASSPDIHREYIASKSGDAMSIEEEVAALGIDAVEEKSMTVFPRLENGTPFLWDYQVKGFFKAACGALNMADAGSKLPAFKKKIDTLVFIVERKIPYVLPEGGKMGNIQRPLRAQTAQGERVALASSETVPAGSTVVFTIRVLDESLIKRVRDWLDYGQYNGIGQWRNARYGTFTWDEIV